MKVVKYPDIKEELLSNLKRRMLLPIIGSGFTRGCPSLKGIVPSGKDYSKHMIAKLQETGKLNDEELKSLENLPFPNLCDIYYEITDINTRKTYLHNNFTGVCLDEAKKKFLSFPWPYLYTLNVDDGIEKNSAYDCIICSNRNVEEDIFNKENCLIKLHGDVWEMLKYQDDKSEIFSKRQYVDSLSHNSSLLNRLKHDSLCQNLIYIGCSLDEEIDLLSICQTEEQTNMVNRYICLTKEPSIFQKVNFKKHGITHCIIFESFDSIYEQLYLLGVEAQKVSCDELDEHKQFSFKKCFDNYNENKPYLFYGKSLLDKHRVITYPYFFTPRQHTDNIVKNIKEYHLQFILGTRCSGKTYTLFDLVSRIKDKDIYVFETKDSLTEKAFFQMLEKSNSVILFDNASLSVSQIEYLIQNIHTLKSRNIKAIVVINKNERDILGVISLSIKREIISESEIPIVDIDNKFTNSELDILNPLLTSTNIGIFRKHQTILDNILYIGDNLKEKSKYNTIIPKTDEIKRLVSLIILATERKIHSSRAVMFDIYSELELHKKTCVPLIDTETTWSFERSTHDNSPFKYVLNAEFWLCRHLSDYARNKENCSKIVSAYKYIIERTIENDQGPNLHYVNKKGTYKDYILFDNINRIFNTGSSNGKEGLLIVKSIYEGLNPLLSIDPNYMRQRAKCYIKLSRYEKKPQEKLASLSNAFRDINVSIQIFEQRYNESANEHILISLDHLKYTKALVFCHKCGITQYKCKSDNSDAILTLYEALTSPFNSYEYAKKDTYNYDNVILKTITTILSNPSLVNENAACCLDTLFKICGDKK